MSDACYCGFESPDFYSAITPTARKAHRCDECRSTIAPGEKYERVTAKWEGSIESMLTCARCLALREYVQAHVPCFCWAHGSMLDDAQETIAEYAHECPGLYMGYGRLRVSVKRAVEARMRASGL